ncbi:MAG: GNAT family N-acetyltransferase [Bacteroidota bacterium]
MRLVGQMVALRPLRIEERLTFFRWATKSDATPHWYGDWYGEEIPTYVVFKLDWPDHYFFDHQLHLGRCFGIEREGKLIGEINYNEVDPQERSVNLDILIAKQIDMGKGFGTEAIQLLTSYLFENLAIQVCNIEVIAHNLRAIRAHRKAGYQVNHSFYRGKIKWMVLECRKESLVHAPTPRVQVE